MTRYSLDLRELEDEARQLFDKIQDDRPDDGLGIMLAPGVITPKGFERWLASRGVTGVDVTHDGRGQLVLSAKPRPWMPIGISIRETKP